MVKQSFKILNVSIWPTQITNDCHSVGFTWITESFAGKGQLLMVLMWFTGCFPRLKINVRTSICARPINQLQEVVGHSKNGRPATTSDTFACFINVPSIFGSLLALCVTRIFETRVDVNVYLLATQNWQNRHSCECVSLWCARTRRSVVTPIIGNEPQGESNFLSKPQRCRSKTDEVIQVYVQLSYIAPPPTSLQMWQTWHFACGQVCNVYEKPKV